MKKKPYTWDNELVFAFMRVVTKHDHLRPTSPHAAKSSSTSVLGMFGPRDGVKNAQDGGRDV